MVALIVVVILAIAVVYILSRTAVVVPQQQAYVVERLGRYDRTLLGGLHILMPFIDVVRKPYHDLRETARTIVEQDCITKDNVRIAINAIIYYKIVDPERASYGSSNFVFAIEQLAQTNLRSEIGKIELDHTFEERPVINSNVVQELDKASEAWGVKVLRYEIKDITPPAEILQAMEKQMRAEREKRAEILQSEGARTAMVNQSEGQREALINRAEGTKQQRIKEAEGQAEAIRSVATATADGIRDVAEALQSPGGHEALQYRVAQQYIEQFGNLAKSVNTMILPANVGDVAAMIGTAMNVIRQQNDHTAPSGTPSNPVTLT
jgi:regulator of protease activity HflC (stomatin/prohibitin superfamily)